MSPGRRVMFGAFTLACFWPGVLFLANNLSQVRRIGWIAALVVLGLCVGLLLAGAAAALLPRAVSRDWPAERALCVAIVAVFLLFAHGAIRLALEGRLPVPGGRTFVYLLVVAGALLLAWRVSRHPPVRLGVAVAAALLCGLPALRLAMAAGRQPALVGEPVAAPAADHRGPLSGEHVYYVILDGYGGAHALRRYLNYQDSGFVTRMGDLGFISLDSARANYLTTQVSLAASLEMDYIVRPGARFRDDRAFFPALLQRGPSPRLVRLLDAAGYDFLWAGNLGIPCEPRGAVQCLETAHHGRAEQVAEAFLAPTQLLTLLRRVTGRGGPRHDALTPLAAALDALAGRPRPFFALVHHLPPHPPFRTTDCSEQPGVQDLVDWGGDVGRRMYRETLACVNSTVLALARRIRTVDPRALVVFQADHGSSFAPDWNGPLRDWSDSALDERSSILNLVALPDACRRWIRPALSPINTMRLVVGCLERRSPEYLPEATILTAYERHPEYGDALDVTARITRPVQP